MSVDFGEGAGSDYHARMATAAQGLAAVLRSEGLETTLEKAQVEAEGFQHGYTFLMSRAADILFRTGDLVQQEPGLDYMAWQAEHFPDPDMARGISDEARAYARDDQREFAGRYFGVSLMHFRFASKAGDFKPGPSFFEEFNGVIGHISEANYPDLYEAALKEFGPQAVAAAENYEPPADLGEEDNDWEKYSIDETLHRVSSGLRKSDPELAKRASELITDNTWSVMEKAQEVDSQVADAFLDEDFELAKQILTDSQGGLIQELWKPMLERLRSDPDAKEWGDKVIDTIIEAKPEYFVGQEYDDAIDFFHGAEEGEVIGRLYRTDVVNSLLNPNLTEHYAGQTVMGIAYGLGTQFNFEGLEHLILKVPKYSEDSLDAIWKNFETGVARRPPKIP